MKRIVCASLVALLCCCVEINAQQEENIQNKPPVEHKITFMKPGTRIPLIPAQEAQKESAEAAEEAEEVTPQAVSAPVEEQPVMPEVTPAVKTEEMPTEPLAEPAKPIQEPEKINEVAVQVEPMPSEPVEVQPMNQEHQAVEKVSAKHGHAHKKAAHRRGKKCPCA